MFNLFKQKLSVAVVHLTLSVAIILLFLLAIVLLWYPGPLFRVENVWEGLRILIPVDAILGPVLTFILFVPGKRGLQFDLTIVATLQVLALFYGGLQIYNQRPVMYSFVGDRFEVVLSSETFYEDIEWERFKDDPQRTLPLTYALPAQTQDEQNHFVFNQVKFQKVPERHYPISDHFDRLVANTLDLEKLKASSQSARTEIDEFISQYNSIENLIFLPLQGTTSEAVVIALNKETQQIVGYLDVNPWLYFMK